MSSPRVVQSASWQSASWRIRELSSNQFWPLSPDEKFVLEILISVSMVWSRLTSMITSHTMFRFALCGKFSQLWLLLITHHILWMSKWNFTYFLIIISTINCPVKYMRMSKFNEVTRSTLGTITSLFVLYHVQQWNNDAICGILVIMFSCAIILWQNTTPCLLFSGGSRWTFGFSYSICIRTNTRI